MKARFGDPVCSRSYQMDGWMDGYLGFQWFQMKSARLRAFPQEVTRDCRPNRCAQRQRRLPLLCVPLATPMSDDVQFRKAL